MRLLHEATVMSRLSACSFYASKYFLSVRATLDLANRRLSRDHVRLHAVNHENRTLHEPHQRRQVHSFLFYPQTREQQHFDGEFWRCMHTTGCTITVSCDTRNALLHPGIQPVFSSRAFQSQPSHLNKFFCHSSLALITQFTAAHYVR